MLKIKIYVVSFWVFMEKNTEELNTFLDELATAADIILHYIIPIKWNKL